MALDDFDGLGNLTRDRRYTVEAGQASPTTRDVQRDELAQHQLDQYLSRGGPLMRRAEAQGMATAGQRGLMNSSLAAGAAQGAMIDRAQPFVLSDADAHRQAASESMRARNEASRLNAQLRTQANQAGTELTAGWDRAAMQADAQALMQEYQRRWQTGENVAQRDWATGERIGGQEWQSGENATQRDWATGERVGQQEWQTGENKLNRDWTSEENMHQRMLQWTTAQLQTFASMRMSENQAMAQVMANIYGNPELTAAEQRAAWANAKRSFEMLYGREFVPPEGFPTYPPPPNLGTTDPGDMGPEPPGNEPPPPPPDNTPPPNYDDPPDRPPSSGGGRGGKDGRHRPHLAGDPLMSTYVPGWPGQPSYSGGTSWPSAANPSAAQVMDGLPDIA